LSGLYLVGDLVCALHRSVGADDEEHVESELDDAIDHDAGILAAARGTQDRAALRVHAFDPQRVEPNDVVSKGGDKSSVPVSEPNDVAYVVVHPELHDERTYHVVEPWAQATAGHDSGGRTRWEITIGRGPPASKLGSSSPGTPRNATKETVSSARTRSAAAT
jgi:hypothetical protein